MVCISFHGREIPTFHFNKQTPECHPHIILMIDKTEITFHYDEDSDLSAFIKALKEGAKNA